MSVYKLSPSSLSLMKECPRCFWLAQHGKWKRPSSIFPSLPSGMDRILKIHFDNFRKKGRLPPELCGNGDCENMKLYDNIENLKNWQNSWKGLSFVDENGNELKGAVDNLLFREGKIIVLDYKTRGYAPKGSTAYYYKDQLDIYNFLLRKNGYSTEDFAFLLFYFPNSVTETGEVIFDTELVKIPVSIENAKRIFKKAIELLNSDCPKEKCEWCEGVDFRA